jgi:hypothetical protein
LIRYHWLSKWWRGEGVRKSINRYCGTHEQRAESPELQIAEVLEKLGPGQWVGLGVASILFNAAEHKVGLALVQEALLSCSIWEV